MQKDWIKPQENYLKSHLNFRIDFRNFKFQIFFASF